MLSSSQIQHTFNKLLEDLKSKNTLCSLDDYQGITLDTLNKHLIEHGPLESPYFGLLPQFYIEEHKLIPASMAVYNKEKICFEIAGLLRQWIKDHPEYGGHGTTSQGAFIFGSERDIRMPDVAYTPRVIDRELSHERGWTYQGKPYSPSFVVEVDTLTGPNSQRQALDYKMRHEYFPHGVDLGWLIDPQHKIMVVYKRYSTGRVYCVGNTSWRDLTGDDVLPEFVVKAVTLDMVLNQEAGSTDEEEIQPGFVCPLPHCREKFHRLSKFAAHTEWHRAQFAEQKYLQNLHHRMEIND